MTADTTTSLAKKRRKSFRNLAIMWVVIGGFNLGITIAALVHGKPLWWLNAICVIVSVWFIIYDVRKADPRISTHNASVIRRGITDARLCHTGIMWGLTDLALKFCGQNVPYRDSDLYHRAWSRTFNGLK